MNETEDERQWGCYDWSEVRDASKELRKLETGHEWDLTNCASEERGGTNDALSGLSAIKLNS